MGLEQKEVSPEERDRKDKILAAFKDKKKRYQDYWDPIYKETEKHRRFALLGKQFEDGEAKQYGLKKPLEPNLLLTYANHEANKTLQTDYRGKVTPNGGGSNEITARERQDVLRGLQRTNNITEIFNQVRRSQVCAGIGYSIAKLDYAGKRGFGKTLKDEFIEDYRNVLPDINVKSPTFADVRDFLIKQDVPKAEWKDLTGRDPAKEAWKGKQTKRLWNYWVREDVRDAEYLMEDGKSTTMGSSLPKKEVDEGEEEAPDLTGVKMDESGNPLMRPTEDFTWCWYKIVDGEDDILDEEEWLGSYPPLVAATGRKVIENPESDGDKSKVYYQPLTQFAEEPQKLYTIIENIIALRLSRSPYSKWKVAYESLVGKELIKLREASEVGDMDIVYKSTTSDGKPIPPPEEMEPKVLDEALLTLQQEQRQKIQQIFGIFDANLGNRSNEQSGVAIEERAKGGELSNYDSQFNYMQYVEQVIRVKLDLIPKYLKAPQQMAFVDEDDTTVMKWINVTGGTQFSPDEEYALSIEATPISQTAREDEANALTNMAKIMPIMAQNPKVVALIIKAQPGRYAAQISELMAGADPQMQAAQQEIQKAQQQNQQLQAKLQQASQTIGALKTTLAGMKQQMGLMKQQHVLDSQSTEIQQAHADISKTLEDTMAALELQVQQYTAESGRITAEAAMLKVVGDLAKPEPATPAPGQGLP
jgi:hypothetical protein